VISARARTAPDVLQRARWRSLFAGVVVIVAGACGDGGSTQLGSPPAALIAISMPIDTVATGERSDPPLAVRVDDALGNPVEGTPVRFIVLHGDGRLFPGVAVSGLDGVAESSFEAGTSPGESTVRADIPSAPNVGAVEFSVIAEAADSVLLSIVAGDGQRAEVGSQLPLPFVVEANTPGGSPAGGVSIVFRIASGANASAVLTADSVLTDADGIARTVMTLGREAREYSVAAAASRGVLSDTARFTATATASFEGGIVLDSVAGGRLVAGASATIHGAGFSPIPSENDVRVEGEPAIVTAATGSALTILAPEFAGQCLPLRDVGVRVLVQSDASNGRMVPFEPIEGMMALDLGEVVTLGGVSAARCLQLPPMSGVREFQIAVGSTSRTAGATLALRLLARTPADLDASTAAGALAPRDLAPTLLAEARQRMRPEAALRQRTLQGLGRARTRVSRPAPRTNVTARAVPVLGDTLEHFFATQSTLTATCTDTGTVVRGVVRAVGQHLVLAEDVQAPAGGPSADEWSALSAELDQVIVPTDTAYFGGYDDIDGNGRVVVLFTPEVNALADGPGGGLGGFFLPLDLAASGSGGGLPGPAGELCPASNEAEILYMIVADPDGSAGPAIGKPQAIRNARGLVAHELQHLINAEGRILHGDGGFTAAEEVWLDEALASVAEEVAGLAAIGSGVGSNLTFAQVSATRAQLDAFNSFQLNNFFNLELYMFDPAGSPTIPAADPGGVGSQQMRGFGWFFLRWLADQTDGDERALFRSLVTGGQRADRGIANIERATGRSWEGLLADFAATIATDGTGLQGLSETHRILTWNFRDVFSSLNRNPTAGSLFPIPFPLQSTSLGFETGALDFDVGASTVRYFTLAGGSDIPATSLAFLTPGGSPLSDSAELQITIVRTR